MDTAIKTFKTFEVSLPAEYASVLKKMIQGLGGQVKAQRKTKKCGLDEALEDVEAGRINRYNSFEEFKQKMLEL